MVNGIKYRKLSPIDNPNWLNQSVSRSINNMVYSGWFYSIEDIVVSLLNKNLCHCIIVDSMTWSWTLARAVDKLSSSWKRSLTTHPIFSRTPIRFYTLCTYAVTQLLIWILQSIWEPHVTCYQIAKQFNVYGHTCIEHGPKFLSILSTCNGIILSDDDYLLNLLIIPKVEETQKKKLVFSLNNPTERIKGS